MHLTRFNPTRNVWRPSNLFNQFFDEPFTSALAGWDDNTSKNWNPKVDIYDNDDNFVVKAELPGVDKKDIKVDVDGRVLSIRGEREVQKEEKEKSCYRREMFYGSFERTFTLPESVDINKIDAQYENGILSLTIPKPEEQKPKEIAVH